VGLVTIPDYRDDLGALALHWSSIAYYKTQGFIPTFVVNAQDMSIDPPTGYSTASAEALQADLSSSYRATLSSSSARQKAVDQFDSEQPSIVVVMDEAFSDLSIYDELACGYTGPAYLKRLRSSSLAYGMAVTSVLGGGTCNTEFEFLSNTSMAFVGAGKYTYTNYNIDKIDSLAKQLGSLGYATHAVHPGLASNWNRDVAYEQMGFDEFIDIEGFDDDAERFHAGVTDRETFDKVLEILKGDDAPQFIYDITMQGHSGYDMDNIPASRLTDYEPDLPELSTSDVESLNEYLSCVQASDEDLEYFVGELEKLDRPVVLVFFGDHQPKLSIEVNDAVFPNEARATHRMREYLTPFVIWTNYEVKGATTAQDCGNCSVNYLSALLFEKVGAPLTEYQAALLAKRAEVPAIGLYGWQDAAGDWTLLDTSVPFSDPDVIDLATLSYLNFAEKV